MASPTFDFDDQLSEDWISQPRSSDVDAGADAEADVNFDVGVGETPKRSSLRSSLLQSRIPLPVKGGAGAGAGAGANAGVGLKQGKASTGGVTSQRPSPRPLHTKSKSELNIPYRRLASSRPASPVPSSLARPVSMHRRSSSAQSWTPEGTVQRRGSEIRHSPTAQPMTPEWRRRLLRGQDVGDDTKDLFSPLGLEGVFRPPSEKKPSRSPSSPRRRAVPRPRAESSTIYPSSPPPYPSSQRRRATTKSTSPSPLREHPPHDQCTGKGGKCEGAVRTPTPTHRKARIQVMRSGDNSRRQSLVNVDLSTMEKSSSIADHESISPVTISRGRIDYRSVQASVLQLRDKMEDLGISERERPSSRSSDHGISYGSDRFSQLDGKPGVQSSREKSVVDSDLLLRPNSFVGLRRGGYSSDDNLYKRPLNMSFRAHESSVRLKSDASLTMPNQPQSPGIDERQCKSSPLKKRGPGSPLKLFGTHDTYTNAHLMRRLSQYVEVDKEAAQGDDEPPSPSPMRSARLERRNHRALDKFGHGDLSTYPFPDGDSFLRNDFEDDEPSLPPVLPSTRSVNFSIPKGSKNLHRSREASGIMAKRILSSSKARGNLRRPSLAEFRKQFENTETSNDGKRIMASPLKDRDIKRRKTLLSSVGSSEITLEPQAPPLVVGKKRKGRIVQETAGQADSQVLAARAMLQPRKASLRASSSPDTSMSSWLGAAPSRAVSVSGNSQKSGNADLSTKILAEDLADFALDIAQNITKEERKVSVTTSDFFKEANVIMRHLRGQRLASGGVKGVELFASDILPNINEKDEDSSDPAKILTHTSNSHGSNDATHSQAQVTGDGSKGDAATNLHSAMKNLKIDSELHDADEKLPDSDPHIRILTHATHSRQQSKDGELSNTRTSNEPSFPVSIRTDNSSGSSKKFNITPETVKGLLSDHVGRMSFDHQKGVWIKNRSGSANNQAKSAHINSDVTDDDPLRNIPDLRDDDIRDTDGLESDITATSQSNATVITSRRNTGFFQTNVVLDSQPSNIDSRPSTSNGGESSQLSKLSKFGSSQTGHETRATSWNTLPSTKNQNLAVEPTLSQVEEVGETPPSTQSEPRVQHHPAQGMGEKSTASPLTAAPEVISFERIMVGDHTQFRSPAHQRPVMANRIANTIAKQENRAKRHLSVVKQRYTDRPVSRIDEEKERDYSLALSQMSPETSIAIVTPLRADDRKDRNILIPPPSTGTRSNQALHRSFQLDLLSEFTIHQADESLNLDVNYVKRRCNLYSDTEVDTHFSLAVRDLVARVTDIEPFEPHWEYITRLELPRRGLMTLHMLEEFCPRVEELDVDENELGQVNGAPVSLRSLSVQQNCLTSVTSWSHLCNLHYLNVSHNQIKSLRSFECLVHMRELILNDNEIDSLDGIENLHGLLKLSLSKNQMTCLDLQDVEMPHLNELDISFNRLKTARCFGEMPKLEYLDLRNNKIESLEFSVRALPNLKQLEARDNCLDRLDISTLCNLQDLNVDGNRLRSIEGLSTAGHLSSLSWRAQTIEQLPTIEWAAASEVRALALTANKLDMLQLKSRLFLNLNKLDLSCCGLEALPEEFGRLVPNLRHLDLSYNSLRDIRPLKGIRKLKELFIVGNRIRRLRNTASVLRQIGNNLEIVDLRTNAVTLGFYATSAGAGSSFKGRSKMGTVTTIDTASPNHKAYEWSGYRASLDEDDKAHRERLDESTMLRRRVYELLMTNSCLSLTTLDGLPVNRDLNHPDKDPIWERLMELKVVKMRLPAP